MSRQCELTGTKPMFGHNVSHSQVKTKRRFDPNLVRVSLHSETLERTFQLRIAAKALRTVDKLGGLDGFLAKAKVDQLSDRAAKIKRDIEKKVDGAEAE
ncbi:MAG: 50S ribosomal protein L28 [Pseudomonadota bacterium]